MPSLDVLLASHYDYRLVVLSVVIAILASYTALALAGRVTATHGRARAAWLTGWTPISRNRFRTASC